jgi:hypothetical protein
MWQCGSTDSWFRCSEWWATSPTVLGRPSFANQFGIHLILAKQEKLASNSLANQLGKNRNLAKLTSPRAYYMRARIVVVIVVSM